MSLITCNAPLIIFILYHNAINNISLLFPCLLVINKLNALLNQETLLESSKNFRVLNNV